MNQKSDRCCKFGPDGNVSERCASERDNTRRKIEFTPVGFWVLSCASTRSRLCRSVGPAHNGAPLFHLGCFIRPTEGNGSTSSAHTASHSCSVSFNLSQRGWAWGTGQRLLCVLLTGDSGMLSALQGPHMQRKTANNLPSYLKCYRGLLFLLLLTLSSLLSVLRKFTAIYVLMSPLCVAMVIYSLWSFSRRIEFTVVTLIYTTRQSNGLVGSVAS